MYPIRHIAKAEVLQLLLLSADGISISDIESIQGFQVNIDSRLLRKLEKEINKVLQPQFQDFFFDKSVIAKHTSSNSEKTLSRLQTQKISRTQLDRLFQPSDIQRETGVLGLVCLYILHKQRLIRTKNEFRQLVQNVWLHGKTNSNRAQTPFTTVIWPVLQHKTLFKKFSLLIQDKQIQLSNQLQEIETKDSHNLLRHEGNFIGRIDTINKIEKLLQTDNYLISVIGAGGIGKTALAKEICFRNLKRFKNKIWFCNLSDTVNSSEFITGITNELPLITKTGINDLNSLAKAVNELGRCLIVLDNFEQLKKYTDAIYNGLIARTPNVKYLVTSRIVLGLPQEQEVHLGPLDYPFEGIQLFEQQAKLKNIDFSITNENKQTVSEIIDQVEGFPLLIQLAASKINALQVTEIRDRLNQSLKLLENTSPTGEEVLSNRIVHWSLDLLSEPERNILAQLSVFDGVFTMYEAEQIVQVKNKDLYSLDLLKSLIDNSLLLINKKQDFEEKGSFRLHRLIRNHASKELIRQNGLSGREATLIRHATYFGKLSIESLDFLSKNLENLIAAFNNSISINKLDLAYNNLLIIYELLAKRGPFFRLNELLDTIQQLCETNKTENLKIWEEVSLMNAKSKRLISDYQSALIILEKLVVHLRGKGTNNEFSALKTLATTSWNCGNTNRAIELYNQTIEIASGPDKEKIKGECLRDLTIMYWYHGQYKKAIKASRQGMAINARLENTRYVALAYLDSAMVYLDLENDIYSKSYLDKAITISKKIDDRQVEAIALMYTAVLAHRDKDSIQAENYFKEAIKVCKEINYINILIQCYINYSFFHLRTNNLEKSEEICDLGLEIEETKNIKWLFCRLNALKALLAAYKNDFLSAESRISISHSLLVDIDSPSTSALINLHTAKIKFLQGNTKEFNDLISTANYFINKTDSSGSSILLQWRSDILASLNNDD